MQGAARQQPIVLVVFGAQQNERPAVAVHDVYSSSSLAPAARSRVSRRAS
jgi:hypothetical protein